MPKSYPTNPLVKLWLGAILRCPHCGDAAMSDGFFALKEQCPNCGVRFHRRAGEMTGAMMLALIALPVVGLGLFFALYAADYRSLWVLLGVPLGAMLVFSVLGYRHLRGVWIAIIELTDGLKPDDLPTSRRYD